MEEYAQPRGAKAVGFGVPPGSRARGTRVPAQRLGESCRHTPRRIETGVFGVTDVVPLCAPNEATSGYAGGWAPDPTDADRLLATNVNI